MSEKRFTSDEEGNILDDGDILTVEEVLEYLNWYRRDMLRFSVENEQLKYDNFMFKGVIKTFQKVAISERKKLEKEIEESKITIQLYEADVSMRDNFLKSKGLYDEFLQCIWTVNE